MLKDKINTSIQYVIIMLFQFVFIGIILLLIIFQKTTNYYCKKTYDYSNPILLIFGFIIISLIVYLYLKFKILIEDYFKRFSSKSII